MAPTTRPPEGQAPRALAAWAKPLPADRREPRPGRGRRRTAAPRAPDVAAVAAAPERDAASRHAPHRPGPRRWKLPRPDGERLGPSRGPPGRLAPVLEGLQAVGA